MNTHSRRKASTPALVYLNAAIWAGLGLLIALDLHPAIPEDPIYRWAMAVLSLLTGGLMVALFRLSRRSSLAYYLLLALLALIGFLTLADEFGLVDLMALVINLLALILLIVNRDDFLIRTAD